MQDTREALNLKNGNLSHSTPIGKVWTNIRNFTGYRAKHMESIAYRHGWIEGNCTQIIKI